MENAEGAEKNLATDFTDYTDLTNKKMTKKVLYLGTD